MAVARVPLIITNIFTPGNFCPFIILPLFDLFLPLISNYASECWYNYYRVQYNIIVMHLYTTYVNYDCYEFNY